MSQLQKAILRTVTAAGLGDPIPVQFNPSSLKLQITNQVEGGVSRAKQERQFTGMSSTTLTLELIFDTADEGATDAPVSVRKKTSQVEQFVYPRDDKPGKAAPPMLRFEWGDLVIQGVVESISLDLEHFAPNGVPLRARVGLSFKEQNRKYEPRPSSASQSAPRPGQASLGAVGSFNAGFSAQAGLGISAGGGLSASAGFAAGASFGGQVGFALEGESAAEFAARAGVDPAAWRGLSFEGGAGGSLSLEAGMEVGLSAGLSASAGIGLFAGASAGASASIEASFGLKAEAGVTAAAGVGANAELQQSFSLSAAGGVSAAIESVKIAGSEAAVNQTRHAFGVPAANGSPNAAARTARAFANPAAPTRPGMPEQSRTPTRLSGLPSPANQQAAPAAPSPPLADPRASSFGFGVPLRPVIGPAALERAGSQGRIPFESKAGGVPVTGDPAIPPWVALPAADAGRKAAGRAQKKGKCHPPCGCA